MPNFQHAEEITQIISFHLLYIHLFTFGIFSLSSDHTDLHRQHPYVCEPLQVAQHLWHRHGASV